MADWSVEEGSCPRADSGIAFVRSIRFFTGAFNFERILLRVIARTAPAAAVGECIGTAPIPVSPTRQVLPKGPFSASGARFVN